MTIIIQKLKRILFYAERNVLIKYLILHLISGYKVLSKSTDFITIKTRFDNILYTLPTLREEYLYAANPHNELLISTFMNLTNGTFIDIGAFIGKHTIRLAKNKSVRVIAIEPNPVTFQLLKRNIELNGVEDRVDLVESALISDDTISEILFEANYDQSKILLTNNDIRDGAIKVKTITFDKLISYFKVDFNNVVIMKIDTEGYEYELLSGMKNFLNNSSNKFKIVCEILHNSPHKMETINYLKELNFNILQVDSENYFIYKN